jgi:hypothetical protein
MLKAHKNPRFVHGFQLPYEFDYVKKLCRKQAKVMQNLENDHTGGIAQNKKYRRLKLGGGQAYDRSRNEDAYNIGVNSLAKPGQTEGLYMFQKQECLTPCYMSIYT